MTKTRQSRLDTEGDSPFWGLRYIFWCKLAKVANSVTRLGDILDLGQLFKALGNN